MNDLHTEVALLKKDIDQLREEVQQLRTDIHDLISAWNTASTVVSFVKWLSGLIAAVGIIGGVSWEFWKK